MAKHSVNRHILGREIGRIWKTKKREGRKNGALSTLPRNSANFSTDDGLRSLIIPRERMNRKKGMEGKKNGAKKIGKRKLYTHYIRGTVGRKTTGRREFFVLARDELPWRTNQSNPECPRGWFTRGAEQRARIPIGTVGYFIATGPQRLVKINT